MITGHLMVHKFLSHNHKHTFTKGTPKISETKKIPQNFHVSFLWANPHFRSPKNDCVHEQTSMLTHPESRGNLEECPNFLRSPKRQELNPHYMDILKNCSMIYIKHRFKSLSSTNPPKCYEAWTHGGMEFW